MHGDILKVEGETMSKSMGNFYTFRDLLEKGYSPTAIRYLLLSVPYHKQLNFTFRRLAGRGKYDRTLAEIFAARVKEANASKAA